MMRKISYLFLLLFATVLFSSHELFLKTDSHFLQPDAPTQLYLLNGTFDTSENAITADRIINSKIIGPDYLLEPEEGQFMIKDKITYLNFTTGNPGTYVAGISTLPRILEMDANAFASYLEHEGLESIITERKALRIDDNGARERYSKHVKSLLQIGEESSMDFMKPLGYPIEFVPMSNPFKVGLGVPISFKLLRNGKPLANQTVHYSTAVPGQNAHDNENATRTNENGLVTIRPNAKGKWYVATIHMETKEDDDVDYESNWATLTFEIK
jgi:uncharacterized GH25 family protein